MLALDEVSVHLWYLRQDSIADEELQHGCLAWLSEFELERYHRFYFDRHRKRFLLGRMLIRASLSQYRAMAPADWRLVENPYGKPALAPEQQEPGLFFNLSHSGEQLVLAVCRQDMVGIDIESALKTRRVRQIAARYFSEIELEALLQLPAAQQLSRFYELWTLKEAYIKACGMGLAIPLKDFSFLFMGDEGLELRFGRERDDDADAWQVWQLDAGPAARLALAVKSGRDRIRAIESRRYSGIDTYRPVATRIIRR